MTNRNTVFLLLLGIAVISTALYFLRLRREGSLTIQTTLLSLDPSKAESLDISCADKLISFKRKDQENWTLVSPFQAEADRQAVEKVVAALSECHVKESKSSAELQSSGHDISSYGLGGAKPPKFGISVNGKERILFGAVSPDGTEIYSRIENSGAIMAVPAEKILQISLDPDAYRPGCILKGDSNPASASVRIPLRQVAVLEGQDAVSLWNLVSSVNAESFVYPSSSAHPDSAGASAIEPSRLAACGLDTDAATEIIFSMPDGKKQSVRFGTPFPGDAARIYALTDGASAIVTVKRGILDSIAAKLPHESRP